MKALNRAELRRPHKDRSHTDYKSSMMLSTGEIRVRPARRSCEPMRVQVRMADGSFKALGEFTGRADELSYYAAIAGTRRERRAARDLALNKTRAALNSGVARDDLRVVTTRTALAIAEQEVSC